MFTQLPVAPGDVLAGKYRVDRVLGAGGMGVVVAARHLQLDEPVAIKFLLAEMLAQPDVVERFARESRAAIKIKSEHGVRVMDVGNLPDGAPYMVMELLVGRDLAATLQVNGPLPVADCIVYVLQACEALAEAHALGIVHRDLKPANLFLVQRSDGTPCIKVLDFGISKVAQSGAEGSMTRTHQMMGSPYYMSPEQMTSARDVDMRADIWSMGAVIYELLTGRTPFEGDSVPKLCASILQSTPASMTQSRQDLPEELQAVVFKCLEKDKNRRWQNVGQLALALSAFGPSSCRRSSDRISRILSSAGHEVSHEPARASEVGAGAQTLGAISQTSPDRTTQRSSRKVVVALAASIALAAIVIIAVALRMRAQGPTSGASSVVPVIDSALVTVAPSPSALSSSTAAVTAPSAPVAPSAAEPAASTAKVPPATKKPPTAPAPPPSSKPPDPIPDNLFEDNH